MYVVCICRGYLQYKFALLAFLNSNHGQISKRDTAVRQKCIACLVLQINTRRYIQDSLMKRYSTKLPYLPVSLMLLRDIPFLALRQPFVVALALLTQANGSEEGKSCGDAPNQTSNIKIEYQKGMLAHPRSNHYYSEMKKRRER